jgi:molybdenum cofactor synthesis domain-containing protein
VISVAILTVSDSSFAGTREDASGPAVRARCETLGWTIRAHATVADELDAIAAQLKSWVDSGEIQLILTTGGTGIAPRDVTPEATRSVLEKELPGIGEVMRLEGRKHTRFAVLSRGLAGTRGRTLIVNLPGSPKGAVESLDSIADILPHAVAIAAGRTPH